MTADQPAAAMPDASADHPLLSVILTTRDRPDFFPIALACYQHQTYPNRELIVVDDGEQHPVDEHHVQAVGGRLLRVTPGTPLGTKLNYGVAAARGALCHKMDDDDWYAPDFHATMLAAVERARRDVCRPMVAFASPFLALDLGRWQVHASRIGARAGSTLLFRRDDWEACPFRDVSNEEDSAFYADQMALGSVPLPVQAANAFIAIRHTGAPNNNGHLWVHTYNWSTVEEDMQRRPRYPRRRKRSCPRGQSECIGNSTSASQNNDVLQ